MDTNYSLAPGYLFIVFASYSKQISYATFSLETAIYFFS